MATTTKPIRLSGHARQQLVSRGASEDEIVAAIRSEEWQPAERGRRECRKTFAFRGTWNGTYYEAKQVRPIFAEEPNEVVVVTVYVYYL